ncbi:MAG TPA: hypothetical protein VKG61_15810 [Streptosporangiaceae bacterium]|nr:hypothetical protein [Streptosporangiaceae bacterium]
MTAAERRGPRLCWRPPAGNLTGRRGAALVRPILLAAGLNFAAVAGLAYIAGFHAVYTSLTRIQWPWLCAAPAALGVSAIGYYLAYRSVYAAQGGYQLSRRQLAAVVAVGFGGLFDTGGIRPDGQVLQAAGASRREAMVRITTLTGMEQAMLALYGCAASIAWLSLGPPGVPLSFTLPWAVIPLPAFAAAFWLASRYRARLAGRAGRRARLAVFLDAVLLIRALFTRPVRHRGAIGGMAVFWAGDALAAWSAVAAFGLVMNGAALLIGYCTGMVFTRRTAPLAGAGTLALILPLTIWASGAPLATAITGVAAYRALCFWLPLPPALAGLTLLRQTTRHAAITRQEPSSSARTPAAATPGPISPTSPTRGAAGLPVQRSGAHISGRNASRRTAHPAGSSAAPIRQGECG